MFDNAVYSYDTCNSTDSWTQHAISTGLSGKHLRASMPATWDPYAFGSDSQGNLLPDWSNGMDIVGKRSGIFVDFFDAVAKRANFTYEWLDVSTASRDELGGWSGCMHDVMWAWATLTYASRRCMRRRNVWSYASSPSLSDTTKRT